MPVLPKIRLKITQNHDMGKRVGGVDFGLLTLILLRDEVQRVLLTSGNQFFLYVEYSISERLVKFDNISILANFSYYFMYEI